MATSPKQLVNPKSLESAQTTQYTAVNCQAIIDKATLTNESGSNVVVSMHICQSGDSPSASNRIMNNRAIAPGESYTCPELVGHIVSNGGFLSGIAGAASAITIMVSGRELT